MHTSIFESFLTRVYPVGGFRIMNSAGAVFEASKGTRLTGYGILDQAERLSKRAGDLTVRSKELLEEAERCKAASGRLLETIAEELP